jgi:hypothetical protein
MEECVDCETMPSVELIGPQTIINVIKDEELPFKESIFENISCSREAFSSLNYSTYYYLYLHLFNCLTL